MSPLQNLRCHPVNSAASRQPSPDHPCFPERLADGPVSPVLTSALDRETQAPGLPSRTIRRCTPRRAPLTTIVKVRDLDRVLCAKVSKKIFKKRGIALCGNHTSGSAGTGSVLEGSRRRAGTIRARYMDTGGRVTTYKFYANCTRTHGRFPVR